MIRNFTQSFFRKTFAALVCVLFLYSSVSAQLPTAQTIANQMTVGWNIGNTYEVPLGQTWNNIALNQQVINGVKAAGFNTVRIPCAWDSYANQSTLVIDPNHFAAVKQAVDLCINNNMYVILNIHWDGGWLENHITTADQNAVNIKQNSYWTQIANYFKNYDEHLIFASANEPSVSDATGMSVLLSYHQTFINAVRATGGNNGSRTLVIQGPSADITKTNSLMNTLPNDPIANRLMVEIHYYTPWQFCGLNADASWGNMFYYWGSGNHSTTDTSRNSTWGEESDVETYLGMMKTKFVDKGIPVVIGEFAAFRRVLNPPSDQTLHNTSINYFHQYVVKSAVSKGMIPVLWETGGVINRNTGAIVDPGVVSSIMLGQSGVVSTLTLQNKGTGLYIDGMYRYSDGSIAGQWAYSGSSGQQWVQERYGNYIKLKNVASGLYLDGLGNSSNGASIGQWSNSGSSNQQWIEETAGAYVRFKNMATGLYLDGMWRSSNGSDLGQWSYSGSDAQLWAKSTLSTSLKSATVSTPKKEVASEDIKLNLYPNPFSTSINLEINNPDELDHITISDMSGKLIETISSPAVKNIQTLGASLQPNMYIVQIYGKNWTKTFKIIKE